MSLPPGIRNRPPLAAPRPDVAKQILRYVFWLLLLVCPLLINVSFQVRGVQWRYECQQVRTEIRNLQLLRRCLLAERAALSTPSQLRHDARRMGLSPAASGAEHLLVADNLPQKGRGR